MRRNVGRLWRKALDWTRSSAAGRTLQTWVAIQTKREEFFSNVLRGLSPYGITAKAFLVSVSGVALPLMLWASGSGGLGWYEVWNGLSSEQQRSFLADFSVTRFRAPDQWAEALVPGISYASVQIRKAARSIDAQSVSTYLAAADPRLAQAFLKTGQRRGTLKKIWTGGNGMMLPVYLLLWVFPMRALAPAPKPSLRQSVRILSYWVGFWLLPTSVAITAGFLSLRRFGPMSGFLIGFLWFTIGTLSIIHLWRILRYTHGLSFGRVLVGSFVGQLILRPAASVIAYFAVIATANLFI
jgi:hypothetical protein